MGNLAISFTEEQKNQHRLMIGILVILLLLGICHSVIFYGYEQVPSPDFTAFVNVGKKLLSFELPEDFKRAPILGILQVGIGRIVGGQHPDLTGGWLLNSILFPLIIILLWLICSQLIGRAGIWVTLVAIINPFVIRFLTQPIAEITLIFFCLLSFYLMFKRSRWSYLAAALATMVRYEGAALIFAAFVLDMVHNKNAKDHLRCLLFAFLASLPLALWLLGTLFQWQNQSSTYYLNLMSLDKLSQISKAFYSLFNVTFSPLLVYKAGISRIVFKWILRFVKILVAVTFLVSFIDAIWGKKWNKIVLFIFFLPYMFVHGIYFFSVPRFYAIVHWMLLIFCFDGLYLIWTRFQKTVKVPEVVLKIMESAFGVGVLIGFILLLGHMPAFKMYSPALHYFFYSVLIALILLLLWEFYFDRFRHWRSHVLTALIMLLIVTGNQYRIGPILGQGNNLIEFKKVTEWFLQDGKSGYRMVSTLANVMQIFAKGQTSRLVSITAIKADSPGAFVKECREKNIRYVAWDSRLCLETKNFYYKDWRLDNIAMLSQPRDFGPYHFIKTFRNPHLINRYIHLFYLN